MSQPGRVTRQTADRFLNCLEQAKGDRREAGKLAGIKERRSYQVLQAIKAKFPELAERLATIDVEKAVRRSQTAAFPAPDGHAIKGVSTLHGPDGEVKAQWVKTTVNDSLRAAALEATVRTLSESLPRESKVRSPPACDSDLLNLYTLTDAHIGMHAWGRETGADWDLKIAEDVIFGVFERMILQAPNSARCIFSQMGDLLHTDMFKALTPGHGHLLDADSRYQKIVEVAVRVVRRIMRVCLTKHPFVHVQMMDANHDPVGNTWLRVLFQALYENEPRVTVETSPSPFTAARHGRTMLCFHHGHSAKNESLPLLFATRFAEMWGQTAYRYAHTGHRHHIFEKEHSGMIVMQHPTLAAPDAHSSRNGWDSLRSAASITYDVRYGEVGRSQIKPEMLELAA